MAATLATLVATPARAEPVDACTDFYTYVNQRWLDQNELPPDRARISSFDALRIQSARLLEQALTDAAGATEPPPSAGRRLVVTDFAAGMDTAAIEARGLAALAPWLDRIGALKSADELPALLGALARLQVDLPLEPYVAPDARDKRRYVLNLWQGGLGLPDREDYFDEGERAQKLRAAYRRYAGRLLTLAGAPADDATLDALMAFERTLAEATARRAQLRDPVAIYNPHTAASLAELAPGFDWAGWLQAYAGRPGQGVIVAVPGLLQAVARQAGAPPATWRSYLRVRLLDSVVRRLPRAFDEAAFEYRDATLRGLRQPLPRGERVVAAVADTAAAEGLGQLYVERAFSDRAQQRALQLVADIRAALAERIRHLDWMADATKARALAKLAALQPKIGRPAQWKTYDGLVFRRDDYAGNALRAAEWQTADRLADLDRPVDRARWNTSPHVVNAFAGSLNDISFPAAILQPPFFDENADDAVNYGAIGAVIGHEITHHFDDRGRQFDADGNLADWWTAADVDAYRQRVDRLAALYDRYEPVPGQHINGRLTLGENVSDLSGVQIAYDGLQIALARRGVKPDAPGPDGLTPGQRFFTAYATLWRSKHRIEALTNQLRTDPHSPGPYRVLGPLSNVPAFAQAFACKPGTPYAPASPITVW